MDKHTHTLPIRHQSSVHIKGRFTATVSLERPGHPCRVSFRSLEFYQPLDFILWPVSKRRKQTETICCFFRPGCPQVLCKVSRSRQSFSETFHFISTYLWCYWNKEAYANKKVLLKGTRQLQMHHECRIQPKKWSTPFRLGK